MRVLSFSNGLRVDRLARAAGEGSGMIPIQTIVEDVSGQRGVVVDDFMNCCDPTEVPVVWDGESGFIGTQESELKVIGPENAQPNAEKCGAGKGAECCIYLRMAPSGLTCERFGHLRYQLIFKAGEFTAKRHPRELYPKCFLEEVAA